MCGQQAQGEMSCLEGAAAGLAACHKTLGLVQPARFTRPRMVRSASNPPYRATPETLHSLPCAMFQVVTWKEGEFTSSSTR